MHVHLALSDKMYMYILDKEATLSKIKSYVNDISNSLSGCYAGHLSGLSNPRYM